MTATTTSSELPAARAIRHFANPRALPDGGTAWQGYAGAAADAARRGIASWPGYAPTPLVSLPGLAGALGIASLQAKDEGQRFGLVAFKALGAPWALYRELVRRVAAAGGPAEVGADALRAGDHAAIVREVTVACATDGNHGRALAWGARLFGCRCIIYLHEHVSPGREKAIRALGAEIVRTPGHYDDSFRQARADCAANGWVHLADTGAEECGPVQDDIMRGYTVMIAETLDAWAGPPPTHVFAQGGVGGLPVGIFAPFAERFGDDRPRCIVVEPEAADCLYRSAVAGRPAVVPGDLDTVMACLAAGEVNYAAWAVLETLADDFLAIPDDLAGEGIRLLAFAPFGDPPLVAGESGVAGIAGLLAACADPAVRQALGLGPDSRVFCVVSEGATDPDIWQRIVGRKPESF